MTTCPECAKAIAKPSSDGDGSTVIGQPRYVRLTPEGKILIACPRCGSELEQLPTTGRLTLFRRRRAAGATSSNGQSAGVPPRN